MLACNMMRFLIYFFLWCMCVYCEGDGNGGVGSEGGVVAVSAYIGVARSSRFCLVQVTC